LLLHIKDHKLQRLYIADSSRAYNSYIFMDDNNHPYIVGNKEAEEKGLDGKSPHEKKTKDKLEIIFKGFNGNNNVVQVTNISVPLNKSMSLEANKARLIFQNILNLKWLQNINESIPEQQNKFYEQLKSLTNSVNMVFTRTPPGGTSENPLIMRFYLTTSNSYKEFRIKHTNNPLSRETYLSLPTPRFIWVCEVFSLSSFEAGQALGEVVLDAASPIYNKVDGAILIHFPFFISQRLPNGNSNELADMLHDGLHDENWEPFRAFRFRRVYPEYDRNGLD